MWLHVYSRPGDAGIDHGLSRFLRLTRLILLGLDDLCVRFIINLPEEDLSSVPRICFQVEEAQWFYEDFIRPLDPSLPSMSLRNFCLRIFQHCPLLSVFSADNHMRAFEEFLTYKTRVPVRGAIMLNEAMDSVVLVKGWKKSANWSFPRGKINKDEDDLDCAVREVYEETGYDLREAGLVPPDGEVHYIEMTMREQQMRLYIFRDIPMDTHFEPRTRKEISKIQWYRLSELPAFRKKGQHEAQGGGDAAANANKFYMVAPFLVRLKKWVAEQKKRDMQKALNSKHLAPNFVDDTLTEEELVFERRNPNIVPKAQEVSMTSTPGLDTLEGATAALHRLLKIQPPTQGLQPEAASAVQSPAMKSSGEALLAILQGKPQATSLNSTQVASPAQKALGVSHMNAPVSMAPPSHDPRPFVPSNIAYPPPFNLHYSDGSYSIQPLQQQYSQQSESHLNLQQNQMLNQPFPQAHTQGHPQQQYQSQQLQHPQPLPPQVGKGVLTGDQIHSAIVPQLAYRQQLPQHSETVSLGLPQPQFPNVHAPVISSVPKQTPKLTSHSLALLNAFKNHGDQATSGAGIQSNLPLSRYTDAISSPPAQLQELSADEGQPNKPNMPDMSGFNMSASVPAPQVYPERSKPSEDHRSSLLNMFKVTSSKTSYVDPAATITTPADIQQGSGASSSRQPSVDPSLNISLGLRGTATNGRAQPQTQVTEPPSPFKPMSILSRPSQIHSKSPTVQEAPGTRPGDVLKTLLNSKAHAVTEDLSLLADKHANITTTKGFQPQILKRPRPVQSSMPAELAAPSPSFVPGMSAQTELERRTGQVPEHKQALLSLFRNGSAAAPAPVSEPQTSGDIPERTLSITPDAMARSRVGSLVSAGGDPLLGSSSRRGSHAPISAADKGFLLGYLDAITKGKDS
jgi:mRNA-decapping enzyme subunit 2